MDQKQKSPWIRGIIAFFVVVLFMNAIFIYAAVKGRDPVVPSYSAEER